MISRGKPGSWGSAHNSQGRQQGSLSRRSTIDVPLRQVLMLYLLTPKALHPPVRLPETLEEMRSGTSKGLWRGEGKKYFDLEYPDFKLRLLTRQLMKNWQDTKT
ncbi:hypothetical protein E2C01_058930 [Portunus trituberculatus]|uniref:Uncharacterized protein n=1 Tax=Portunus trituberculatus TaxID=210409 RepID=A0A5B7H4R3_PORTR|nr:hypothetical protein [Portunus trituberculatus]